MIGLSSNGLSDGIQSSIYIYGRNYECCLSWQLFIGHQIWQKLQSLKYEDRRATV